MAKETAEQKLLRLIESADQEEGTPSASASTEPSPSPAPDAAQVAQAVKGVGVSSLEAPGFVGAVLSALQTPLALLKNPAAIGLKDINKLMLMLIPLAAFVFVRTFFSGLEESQSQIVFEESEDVISAPESPYPEIKSADEYAAIVERRNIFQPYEPKIVEAEPSVEGAEGEAAATTPTVQPIQNMTADLKLVGISWLDTYDSVTAMIEDNKTSITHFLQKGDSIKGVTVEEIYADRVILSYEGQVMNLKL